MQTLLTTSGVTPQLVCRTDFLTSATSGTAPWVGSFSCGTFARPSLVRNSLACARNLRTPTPAAHSPLRPKSFRCAGEPGPKAKAEVQAADSSLVFSGPNNRQNLANLVDFGMKEPYMLEMNDFIREKREMMMV